MPYETRHAHDSLDSQDKERFTKETWMEIDACKAPWPFPDKYFDFVFCSNMLEDVRDPLSICSEMMRVSKSGYLVAPSRAREIFSKARFFNFRSMLGNIPEVGFYHHRWFVEIENEHIRFTVKDQRLLLSRKNYITHWKLGRKMTEEESGIGLFWGDSFTYEEEFLDGKDKRLGAFREKALSNLLKE